MSSHFPDYDDLIPPSGEAQSRTASSNKENFAPDDGAHDDRVGDESEWPAKKKKIRDRPWKKAEVYGSPKADDLDVIGVDANNKRNPVPTNDNNNNKNDDDDSESESDSDSDDSDSGSDDDSSGSDSSPEAGARGNVGTAVRNQNDDLPSRWTNDASSEKEVMDAHNRAVGQASQKVAKEERERMGRERLSRMSNHNQVRMEALKLLEAAESSRSLSPTGEGSRRSGKREKFVVNPSSSAKDLPYPEIEGKNNSAGPGSSSASHGKMEDVPYPEAEGKNNASNRYSIDRHLRALNGGLTSQQAWSKLNRDHYNKLNQNTSATNMCKTSPHENDNERWNVAQGQRSYVDQGGGRLLNTLYATVRDSVSHVSQVLSSSSKADAEHTTQGAHRRADHTSPRNGIFTGVALTNFLERLTPKSRAKAEGRGAFEWDTVNLMNGGGADEGARRYKNQQSRNRMFWFAVLVIALLAIMGIFGVTRRARLRHEGIVDGPTFYDVGEEIKFYVMSDIPVNKADETKLKRELAELHPRNGDFLIHLGDISKASTSLCTFSVYDDVADILKTSPIPTLILPGDNDWNDCPMPDAAFDYWMEKMNKFEENFDESTFPTVPIVDRQLGRQENFAFLTKGVLFIGLNLVDGTVQDEREWSIRHQENLQWVEEQLDVYEVQEYRAIVLLGHAGYTGKVGDFFWPVMDDFKRQNKPVLYLHASDGDGMIQYNPVDNFKKFTAVRLQKGSIVAPTQVTVKSGAQPFELDVHEEK